MHKALNIFDSLPKDLKSEVFEDIVRSSPVRIERIVSKGHASPDSGWYDQDENEWVMVVEGKASLIFEDGSKCDLSAGDYINIPAHVKHKVAWTDPDEITVWLAVFYK
ncbi:cupin domain-containing protein [Ectothiorhodospira lacustris]|uniref:cupin domain-containing protein n=1 Tax=Ectothiorhodospira lacustris TaxID=2899127 RepID=UPI001EE79148|nr:cupin domain-containing protein [Ectothiorhodospira lacustris]MCG5500624.1 cupin domain-containing protein [Ectothiorhodospira lacustris]MCG5510464.1 cupin domain-containing protein [Ectothiorhodospira lacustris]MCG5522210.1 cupin domain-containing protein [Ectothiorhodospira lacustris]